MGPGMRPQCEEEFGVMTGAELALAMKQLREKHVLPAEPEASLVIGDTQPLVPVDVLGGHGASGPAELVPRQPRPLVGNDIEISLGGPLEFDIDPVPLLDDDALLASPLSAATPREDAVHMLFEGANFKKIKHDEFARELQQQLRHHKVSEAALAQVNVVPQKTGGVVEIMGSGAALDEIREKIQSGSFAVMGAVGNFVQEDHDANEGEAAAAILVEDANDRLPAKRRKKAYFIWDEATEIAKDTYEQFVCDRGTITRKNVMDYKIFLPHFAPHLPHFTTTFTDLCPSLASCLLQGSEVAEKRRRLMQEVEGPILKEKKDDIDRHGLGLTSPADSDLANGLALPVPPGAASLSPKQSPVSGILSPILGSAGSAGLKSPLDLPAAGNVTPSAGMLITENELLEGAPTTLAAVVTSSMDTEYQSGNQEARVGYSGRTEKMHRYLAREFEDSRSKALSYEELCRSQAPGRHDLIAGCFFELLVLKTNGVIGLKQDAPKADIKISKAKAWAQETKAAVD